jgi:hypothetical protein
VNAVVAAAGSGSGLRVAVTDDRVGPVVAVQGVIAPAAGLPGAGDRAVADDRVAVRSAPSRAALVGAHLVVPPAGGIA